MRFTEVDVWLVWSANTGPGSLSTFIDIVRYYYTLDKQTCKQIPFTNHLFGKFLFASSD